MKKKILTIVLVVLSLLCGIICLSACSESENAENSSSSNIEDSSTGHVHAFTLQKTDSEYLKSEATCAVKAVYYYSCTCGAKGNEIFEYGELANHTYSATWEYNSTHHWQESTCGCNVTKNYAEHSLNTDDVCTICSWSAAPTEGVSYALSSDGTYYVVNDYSGTSPIVIIAKSYNGLPVKEIADGAFYDNTTVTEIIIPSSVTAINSLAFRGCNNLTSITIPDGVTSIGWRAFENCESLTSVTIGNSVTSIDSSAFSYCDKIIVKYNGVYYVDNWVIGADSSITSAIIKDKARGIAGSAFKNCYSLTSVTIPDSVTSIGYYAFFGCSKLTSVTIGNGVTSIGEAAFLYCSSLTSITIPDSVTSIGSDAFESCDKLVEIINKSELNITKGSEDHGRVAYYALNVKTEGESDIVNDNDYLFYTYDGTNYLLGYTGNETNLVLPDKYNGQSYEIYKYAFA